LNLHRKLASKTNRAKSAKRKSFQTMSILAKENRNNFGTAFLQPYIFLTSPPPPRRPFYTTKLKLNALCGFVEMKHLEQCFKTQSTNWSRRLGEIISVFPPNIPKYTKWPKKYRMFIRHRKWA
jgi:hypothetical protein